MYMTKIRTVIADDEPLSRERLRKLISKEDELELIKACENGQEAIDFLKDELPDLLFLDIQMPEIDGFEVLKQIDYENIPCIVFVTAYDEYALRAFEVNALDYLLKPFDQQRFVKAVNRVKDQLKNKSQAQLDTRLTKLVNTLDKNNNYLDRIMIKANGRVYFVKTNEIDWIEAAGNYLKLHCDKKNHMVRETMSNMEEKLDPDQFFRIHRSVIVNIEKIRELQPWFHGDYMITLLDGQKLTMSRNYKDLLQRF